MSSSLVKGFISCALGRVVVIGGLLASGSASETETFPALPESVGSQTLEEVHLLEVGGASLGFENLGPIIINTDGTTRRMSNWDILTKQEKASAWRRIAARNAKRTKVLLSGLPVDENAQERPTEETEEKEESNK